jgi:hypothetical protein
MFEIVIVDKDDNRVVEKRPVDTKRDAHRELKEIKAVLNNIHYRAFMRPKHLGGKFR